MVDAPNSPPSPLLSARRAAVESGLSDGWALVVLAGQPVPIPGGHDQCWPYRPHPRYAWLAGSHRPGAVLTWSASDGWTHFVPEQTVTERLWEGGSRVPEGEPISAFAPWLERCRGLQVATVGAPSNEVVGAPEASRAAADVVDAARRPKDAWELARMREAVSMTAEAFRVARECARPGATEREIRIRLEAAAFLAGASAMGYDSIVGAGQRSAVLHGSPGWTRLRRGDLVLVDAGASTGGYTADVTRTWICEGTPDTRQKCLLKLVAGALKIGSSACIAGTEWHVVHQRAALHLAEGLVGLGLLRGKAEDRCDDGSISVFFPHGIGHLVGLGVRDAGGVAPGRPVGRLCCGARPRIDLPLEPGFVVTVEPGLYFVDALLDNPDTRHRFSDAIQWQEVERWRGIGGVRLEDNLLVMPEEPPENLTASIPLPLP